MFGYYKLTLQGIFGLTFGLKLSLLEASTKFRYSVAAKCIDEHNKQYYLILNYVIEIFSIKSSATKSAQ